MAFGMNIVVTAGQRLATDVQKAAADFHVQQRKQMNLAAKAVEREVKLQLSKGKSATTLGIGKSEEGAIPGRLRASITSRMTGAPPAMEARIGPQRVIYAAIHEFGGVIRPRTARFLVFTIGGRKIFARKVTMPKRPYLVPGAAAAEPIVIRLLGESFRPILDAGKA